MFELLISLVLVAVAFGGFVTARRFVRDRLRYVDAVQRSSSPWLAGIGTTLAALPVVWILPVVGLGTAVMLGASVGLGVARGLSDIRRLDGGGWSSLPRM